MSKKILIIEDETALLYALQSQLAVEGFQTFVADDGAKALEIIRRIKPDLIVLDLLLPRVDGWTFLAQIKKVDALKNIPVVIISNLSDDASQKRGLELGANDYLAKVDYSLEELVMKIKGIIK